MRSALPLDYRAVIAIVLILLVMREILRR